MPTSRAATAEDRTRIREILEATTLFTPEEVGWAMELVDACLAGNPDYAVSVALDGQSICGYVCFGPVKAAAGFFDLYWIAVHPEHQKAGHGRHLLEVAEAAAEEASGTMLLIETSSGPSYATTRRFYERNGYHEISRTLDFYRVRPGRVVYGKEL
jgi:ribosomal protein S18 acetylase RimI-like enzyme